MVQTILQAITLRVDNPDRAAAFYIALGLPFVKNADGSGGYSLMQGDILIEIQAGLSQGARLRLQVPDLETSISNAGRAGGRLEGRPEITSAGKKALLLDPAGNRIELVEVA